MSGMAHDFFAASPLLVLPIISLLVFAGVFLLVTWRTMRTPKDEISSRASLPLEDDFHV